MEKEEGEEEAASRLGVCASGREVVIVPFTILTIPAPSVVLLGATFGLPGSFVPLMLLVSR